MNTSGVLSDYGRFHWPSCSDLPVQKDVSFLLEKHHSPEGSSCYTNMCCRWIGTIKLNDSYGKAFFEICSGVPAVKSHFGILRGIISNCAKNDRQQIRCSHSWPGRNAENPSESKEIMCADILVGRDAFLQCIAARDKSNYVKRKHGTHIVFFVILLYLFDSEVCTRCNSHVFLGPLEKANIRSVSVATYLGFPSFGARTCQHRVREDRPCCSAPPFHRRLDNAKILQRDPPDV